MGHNLDDIFDTLLEDNEDSIENMKNYLHIYYENKNYFDSYEKKNKFLTYFLAKCYKCGIQDESLVEEVIRCIMNIDEGRDPHHVYSVFSSYLLRRITSRSEVPKLIDNELHFFEYLLRHSNNLKLSSRGARFEWFLLSQCLQYPNRLNGPNLFFLLLRYGASLHVEKIDYTEDGEIVLQFPFQGLTAAICRPPIVNNSNRILFSSLMRTVPNILHSRDRSEPRSYTLKLSNLKNLCRFVIRRELWKRWRLPDGTSQLLLPTVLKGYLDLDDL